MNANDLGLTTLCRGMFDSLFSKTRILGYYSCSLVFLISVLLFSLIAEMKKRSNRARKLKFRNIYKKTKGGDKKCLL